jgi:cell division transport system permease protein
MALPQKFFQPSFKYRRLDVFLAVIVGIMVYMATFVTATETSLSVMTLAWDNSLTNRMTVEIPAVDDEASFSQADRVKQAVSILRAMPGVSHITPVKDEEATRLLQPWIPDQDVLKALPIPSLIDIEREAGSKLTADDVRLKLRTTLRDVRVDDHIAWLGDFARFVNGIAAFGGLMILLSALTLVLAVSLVCRTIMATEKETITLLHTMGADDHDIARHFEHHARQLSMHAALTGCALAVVSTGILLYFMRHFANPSILHAGHWVLLVGAVLSVPLAAIWISSLSARLSVLNCLRFMP